MVWILNQFLFLLFLSGSPLYQVEVDAGSPCWGQAYIDGVEADSGPQPPCPYDPSNVNQFVYVVADRTVAPRISAPITSTRIYHQ